MNLRGVRIFHESADHRAEQLDVMHSEFLDHGADAVELLIEILLLVAPLKVEQLQFCDGGFKHVGYQRPIDDLPSQLDQRPKAQSEDVAQDVENDIRPEPHLEQR